MGSVIWDGSLFYRTSSEGKIAFTNNLVEVFETEIDTHWHFFRESIGVEIIILTNSFLNARLILGSIIFAMEIPIASNNIPMRIVLFSLLVWRTTFFESIQNNLLLKRKKTSFRIVCNTIWIPLLGSRPEPLAKDHLQKNISNL